MIIANTQETLFQDVDINSVIYLMVALLLLFIIFFFKKKPGVLITLIGLLVILLIWYNSMYGINFKKNLLDEMDSYNKEKYKKPVYFQGNLQDNGEGKCAWKI